MWLCQTGEKCGVCEHHCHWFRGTLSFPVRPFLVSLNRSREEFFFGSVSLMCACVSCGPGCIPQCRHMPCDLCVVVVGEWYTFMPFICCSFHEWANSHCIVMEVTPLFLAEHIQELCYSQYIVMMVMDKLLLEVTV